MKSLSTNRLSEYYKTKGRGILEKVRYAIHGSVILYSIFNLHTNPILVLEGAIRLLGPVENAENTKDIIFMLNGMKRD